MSRKEEKYHDSNLKHIKRKELLKELKKRGHSFTTYDISNYYKEMKEQGVLNFLSRKQGYSYQK